MRFSFSFFPLFYMYSHLLLWKLSPSPPPPSSFDTATTSNNESNAIDSFNTPLLPTLVLPALLVLSIIYLLYHRHRRQATNPFDLKQDVLQQDDAILPDDNNNDDDESLCHQQHQQQESSSSSSRYCKHLQLVLSCIVATGWLCCMMMVDVYAAVYFVIWVSVVMYMWCTFVCVCVCESERGIS